jgi:hypothetical protein
VAVGGYGILSGGVVGAACGKEGRAVSRHVPSNLQKGFEPKLEMEEESSIVVAVEAHLYLISGRWG